MSKQIRVYADWQPGYMGERAPTKNKYFKTLEEARPTIEIFRKTACTVIVSEEKVLEKYSWGKKRRSVPRRIIDARKETTS